MNIQLKFSLTTKSDYHIGSGFGLGVGIDSALHLDSDGVEVIRGTILTGLLRDGLWRLLTPMQKINNKIKPCDAAVAGTTENKNYCGQFFKAEICPICRLFGNPVKEKHWRITSARPADRTDINAVRECRRGQIVQRVAIDPKTRRAVNGKLFTQEMGKAELDFRFSIKCDAVYDESILDEAALWTAAARNIRVFGQSRNRGLGECLVQLLDLEGPSEIIQKKTNDAQSWQDFLLEHFKTTWLSDKLPGPCQKKIPRPTINIGPATKNSKKYRLLIRTDEPVLISQRAEAGNQFEGGLYIPGQTLRGAFAWRAANYCDLTDNHLKKIFTDIFQQDRVLFPMLYPADQRICPAIPVPLDMVTCKTAPGTPAPDDTPQKGFGHGVWSIAKGELPEDGRCTEPNCKSGLKRIGGFAFVKETSWNNNAFSHTPNQSTEMHIRINPLQGAADEGALYGYVTLNSGQYFVGDIICPEEYSSAFFEMTGIETNSPFTLRLGRAANRGYGKVTCMLEEISFDECTGYGLPLEERIPGEPENSVIMTLFTPTIILDTWGRLATGFSLAWLEQELGFALSGLEHPVASTVVVDGFNSLLRLPRWRDIALTAGSSVVLKTKEPLDFDKLRKIENSGIGLRRGEGFGRIIFNHPFYTRCKGVDDLISPHSELGLATSSCIQSGFEQEWVQYLENNDFFSRKYNAREIALIKAAAVLLHTTTLRKIEEIKEKLSDQFDLKAIPKESLQDFKEVTAHQSEKREERNKLIQEIGKMLDALSEQADNHEQFTARGLKILADYLAEIARKSEE